MVAVLAEDDAWSRVAALTCAVDDLLTMTFTSLPGRDLPGRDVPGLGAAVEEQLRRVPVFGHALIAEMDRRDVAGEVGARNTATVLVDALRIAPGEARARVKAAQNLGPLDRPPPTTKTQRHPPPRTTPTPDTHRPAAERQIIRSGRRGLTRSRW